MNPEEYLNRVEEMVEKVQREGLGRYILTASGGELKMVKPENYRAGLPLLWLFNHNSFTFGLTAKNWNCIAGRIKKCIDSGELK